MSQTLVSEFEHYSNWRNGVAERIVQLRDWLSAQELNDAETDLKLKQLLDRLQEDRLNVAFVAEFSRGKSELINAIFFSDYRQRVLPSAAGRTTMCPTELYYEVESKPSIRLLPIQTKARKGTVSDFKRHPDEWTELALDVSSADQMRDTLSRLSDTMRVSGEIATEYGLINPDDEETARALARDGNVEIPRWRHALINFPHPLLEQGLVILDTPGLNAIGTEPELTLNLLPNAHAVLFILAADTGVTKSDIEIWRKHIAPLQGSSGGRLVVLNKIDGLWDDLKSTDQVNAEIARQVRTSAAQLELPESQVYPVSAQKALVAKVQHNAPLLEKSRLPELENALTAELIPCKQDLVRDSTRGAIEDVVVKTTELLEARLANIQDQIEELETLRGKNRDVVADIMHKVNQESQQFDKGISQFKALRTIFAHHASKLRKHLGMQRLHAEVKKTRSDMDNSRFSREMREAMLGFFKAMKGNLSKGGHQVDEIQAMMTAMYRKFSTEHGLPAVNPPSHNLIRFHKEIDRLERIFNERFNTILQMLTQGQRSLTAKFFETLASRVVNVYEIANRETEAWLKALIAPMETQVREHQIQLKRRLESVQRIHDATETLEERIRELGSNADATTQQIEHMAHLNSQVMEGLVDSLPKAAHFERSA
jgi:prefoldin subunit 5